MPEDCAAFTRATIWDHLSKAIVERVSV